MVGGCLYVMATPFLVSETLMEDLCRTCLAREPVLLPVFETFVDNISIQCIITDITGLKVQPNDGFPLSICSNCKEKAENAYHFKKKSEESEAILQKLQISEDFTKYVEVEVKNHIMAPNIKVENDYPSDNDLGLDLDFSDICSKELNLPADVKKEKLKAEKSTQVMCDICSTNLQSKDQLKIHLENGCLKEENPEDSITFCNLCGICFGDSKRLIVHLTQEHSDNSLPKVTNPDVILNKLSEYGLSVQKQNNNKLAFDCVFCKVKFKRREEWTTHINAHKEEKVYCCQCCKKMYLDICQYEVHVCMDGNNEVEQKSTETRSMVESTLQNVIGRNDRMENMVLPQVCHTCQQVFLSHAELLCHIDNEHPEKSQRCNICLKVFSSRKAAGRHRSLCRKVQRNYQCTICNLKFPYEISLRRHILRDHEGVSVSTPNMIEAKYQCNKCPNSFESQCALLQHKKNHLPNFYECDTCHKKFNRKDNLRSHTRIHDPSHLARGSTSLCLYCGKSFNSSSNLIVHMRRHTGEKPYKCEFCGKGFPRSSDLQIHRRMHTGEKPCVCTVCDKAFARSYKLSRHMRVHTGLKPYKCTYCDKAFSQSNDLTIHVRRHTGDKPYICEVCGDRFIQVSGYKLSRHMRVHTGLKPYKCTYCDKAFSQSNDLTIHVRRHTGDKPYICEVCGDRFIQVSGYKLSRHMRVHTGLKPYKCTYCDKAFSQSNDLTIHVRRHTGDKPYICEVCGDRFIQVSGYKLSRHMRVHTGLKPYKCTYCDKAFSQSNDLTIHVRRHTGDKPYICEVCGDRFIQVSGYKLSRHMRVHTGLKPYKCTYCDKAFSQSNDLTIHVRRHTGARGDKPYICEVCGDRFIQNTALTNHKRAHNHYPSTTVNHSIIVEYCDNETNM